MNDSQEQLASALYESLCTMIARSQLNAMLVIAMLEVIKSDMVAQMQEAIRRDQLAAQTVQRFLSTQTPEASEGPPLSGGDTDSSPEGDIT